MTVLGCLQMHTVAKNETLLDIARKYGLGFNEIQLLHPNTDPWVPKPGTRLTIPTLWVLPETKKQGVVINIPEMRLYRFFPKIGMVKTYPVGIGDLAWETPEGIYRIISKEVNPTWVIPKSLRKEYGAVAIPPGPENPLGRYWLGLSRKGYGIHGTNFPWGVGRLVSHGCIRLYPEHIVHFFQETPIGTPVELVYQPVKIGLKGSELYIEVHPDIYHRTGDLESHAKNLLQRKGIGGYIWKSKMLAALREMKGVPVLIGSLKEGGDRSVSSAMGSPLPPGRPDDQDHMRRKSNVQR